MTEEIALPKRELILDGLQSQQDYWIVGVARENDRRTHSPRFKVRTGGGLGLSHINAGKCLGIFLVVFDVGYFVLKSGSRDVRF
jgi:hypothetical protein